MLNSSVGDTCNSFLDICTGELPDVEMTFSGSLNIVKKAWFERNHMNFY